MKTLISICALILVPLWSSLAPAETIEFRNRSQFLKAELNAKNFTAQSSRENWSAPVTACNKKMIHHFFESAKRDLKQIQMRAPAKVPSNFEATFDRKTYAVARYDRQMGQLSLLPKKLSILKYQAGVQCKK